MAGVDTVTAGPLTAMDVSCSGELMCFADADGALSLWADRPRTCAAPTRSPHLCGAALALRRPKTPEKLVLLQVDLHH